ncbi:MAG: glycosyltransferase family 4 protein [Chloroflexales bacterium]|nr:glycosyltransferase family 4 protein [Chloroflexales bacterium]
MQSLRIAMLAPFGITPKGTLLARMLPLANALVRAGHSVQIIAPPIHNPQDAGTTVVHDRVPVTHTLTPTWPSVAGVAQQSLALWRGAITTTPDLIHLFKPKGQAGLAAHYGRMVAPGIPLVVDCDDREGRGGWNDHLGYPASAKALFAWQEARLPQIAQSVTVASRTLEGLVWAQGVARMRVFYIPNAADLGQAPAPVLRTPTRMLLYTRFWEFRLDDLIATMQHIVSARPDIQLTVIGSGEHGEEHQLLELAQTAGIARHFEFRGWMQPHDIPAALADAGIALVPVDDTLINRARCSAKLLELLAAGLPVVGNDVGEMRTFVHTGVNGILTPPRQPQALADAVLALMADQPRWHAMQRAAYLSAQQHTWDSRVSAAEAAYTVALH